MYISFLLSFLPDWRINVFINLWCCVNFHLLNFYFGNTSKENSAIAIICTRIFSVSDNFVQPNYLSSVVKHDMMGLPENRTSHIRVRRNIASD